MFLGFPGPTVPSPNFEHSIRYLWIDMNKAEYFFQIPDAPHKVQFGQKKNFAPIKTLIEA